MKKNNSDKSGTTLVVVLTLLLIIMVMVAIAVDYTTSENRNVQRTTTMQTEMAIGDSAIDVLFNGWRTGCRSNVNKVFATADFAAGGTVALATPSPFPGCSATNFIKRGTNLDPNSAADTDNTYTISNYKVVAVDAEYNPVANSTATPEPQLGQLKSGTSLAAPTARTPATWNYMASADVTVPVSFGSKLTTKIRRVFSKQQQSPWNYAIFFVDPLEIHPGPLFTVTGWVNTNSNLYTGHSSLTFADKVTYTGDWFESTSTNLMGGFMTGDTYHLAGDPANGPPTYPSNLPPARGQALQPLGLDSSLIFSTSDSNPNNDSYHELIEPPVTSSSDPLAGARYWDQAAIIIQIADNPSKPNQDTVTYWAVNNISTGTTTQITSSSSAPYNSLYNMFNTSGVITTNTTIQDNREGTGVKVATIDLSKLETGSGTTPTWAQPASGFSSNPIIYIYDSSTTATTRRGIRIINGSKIPTTGLTIASNNSVYLQGDFNTGGTGTAVPSNNPANLNADGTYPNPSNPPNPQVNGYTRAPCSIVADAVNILSSNFNTSETGIVAPSPAVPAANTTINAAIISGIVPTNVNGDGAYSGGAENFPRFLEDWGANPSTLTYYGSMVELYASKYAIGEWGKANVYNPPTRQWYFDNNFTMNPPPGSIMLHSYTKGRWTLQ